MSLSRLLLAALCLIAAGAAMIAFFEQFPIEGTTLGMDWRGLYRAVEGGRVHYENSLGFRIPPWSAALVAPLGLLSFRASWGVLALLTLAVQVFSVPRAPSKGLYLLSVALVAVSFPSLRHIADGNLEALVIAGAVLTVSGYQRRHILLLAGGLLLVVSKPQAGALLALATGVYALMAFPPRLWLRLGGLLAAVVVPFMLWRGGDWLTTMFAISQRGSIMDTSLAAALNRLGLLPGWMTALAWGGLLVATLWPVWRTRAELTREKAGLLIAASLLLAPYSAANSVLTVLAVGVIPLFQKRPLIGSLLIALINLPFLFPPETQFNFSAYYTTALLLVIWGVFGWRVWQRSTRPQTLIQPIPAHGMYNT